MKKPPVTILLALALALLPTAALEQSSPNLIRGQVPTAAQWNQFFQSKQDLLGYVPLNTSGGTMQGTLTTLVSSALTAGLNLPHGVAPTTPNNGDLWTTTAGLFAQVNGNTVGPYGIGGGGGGSGTVTSIGFTAGSGLAVSGSTSPIATAGTFQYSLATVANNTVMGNISGSTAAPGPLSQSQLTNLISIGAGLQVSGGSLGPDPAVLASLTAANQTISGGAVVTTLANSTGSLTVNCGARPVQSITNNGAYTITAPSSDGSCMLMVTNGASAGATTFTGFSVGSNTGDSLTTTNTNKFTVFFWRAGGTSGYRVAAHQ